MIRFCLHPGPVYSVNDGDDHFIGAHQLADLYGVKSTECVVITRDNGGDLPRDYRGPESRWRGIDLSTLLHLYPSKQGAAYWHISETERQQYPTDRRRTS